MFIVKGGISREIDEKDLQAYRDKGYAIVGVEKLTNSEPDLLRQKPQKEKSLNKMTTAELEAKAAELEADISDCKNNAERAAKIEDKLLEMQEGGE